ncbi:unnamed protein product [Polarella glacialis]|uniref:Uncharacterized protein n=1 Tax=Polarella glacialis TaxID=89957 RepID=A0A813GKU3_POLGL|nr:unnamed protein product [Polarella glacialis]
MTMAWQHSTSVRTRTPPTSWRTSMRGWVLQIEVTFNTEDNDILTFNIDDNGILNDIEKGHLPLQVEFDSIWQKAKHFRGEDKNYKTEAMKNLEVEFDSLWQKAKQFSGEDKNNKIEVMKNLENYCLIPYHALNDPLRPRARTTRKLLLPHSVSRPERSAAPNSKYDKKTALSRTLPR